MRDDIKKQSLTKCDLARRWGLMTPRNLAVYKIEDTTRVHSEDHDAAKLKVLLGTILH